MENIKFLNYNKSEEQIYKNFKSAGIIHKNVKLSILRKLENEKPNNYKLIDFAKFIEEEILKNDGGIAFPVGLSINNCCCHWTPNPNENRLFF